MKIIGHVRLALVGLLCSVGLTGCFESGGGSGASGGAAPKPSTPTLADDLKASPFDISSIAVLSIDENPKFLTPENIEVIYPAETIRPLDTTVTTIERTISIGANAAGKYLLKLQNGNYGPFLAQNCNLQMDKNLKFQCQYDNLIETYEKSFTRMYAMNVFVNGVKIGTAKNLIDTTKSYRELPIQLNETDNIIKITYQGYPSSFTLFKIEKYPAEQKAPSALFTMNRLTGTTATAFVMDAKDSFDSHDMQADALTYEWDFGDGTPLENAANHLVKTQHTYAAPGEYSLSLKVTSKNMLSETFATTVLVRDPVAPPVSTLKKPIGVMSFITPDPNATLFAQFSAQGSYDLDGNIVKYEWDFGDKNKFEGLAVGHLYKKGGTYTVRLTLTDDSGLKAVVQRLVSVKESSDITVAHSVFSKEYTGSLVNPTKYTETFSVDPKRIGALYKVTILNADGLDHPIKTCSGTSAEVLQCKYDNLVQSSYVKLSRASSAYITINGVRIADSTSINSKKYVYLTYAHLQKDNQIQVSVYGYPTAFLSVNIEMLDLGTEGVPPEISTNIAGNILTSNPTMNIKVFDTSSVYTTVSTRLSNEETAGATNIAIGVEDQDFDVNLIEGDYTYTITAADSWGNVSQFEVPNLSADFTDPTFQLSYIADNYAKVLPAKVKVVVNTSEPCKSVKVNNVNFSASADRLRFTGYLTFAAEGSALLTTVATDMSGRVTTVSGQEALSVYFDPNPPQISYTEQPSYIASTSTFYLPVKVVDDYATNVLIKVNGVLQFETTSNDFTAPIILPREGANTVTFEAKDLAGNSSGILSLSIIRDTKPPILAFVTPTSNAYVDGYETRITVTTNEKLTQAHINGTPFEDVSGLTLSMVYYLPPGQSQLTVGGYDSVNNYSEKVMTVRPLYFALNPDLTSISIDDQLKKILVKGAVGATRPNLDVKISRGFFSSTTVRADSRGSFAALIDLSDSVEISVYDSVNRYTEKTTLYASSAAETLIGGQIRDELDNPLPNVAVSILGADMVVKTNSNGVFSFSRAKFPTQMVTGNQELIIDGSTVPKSFTGGTKKYGRTNIKVSIGLAKNNILSTPVYLAPVYLDGSATSVSASSGGAVQDVHAPGVILEIPSGATSFPSGKTADLISVQTLPAARSTVPTPEGVSPANVVALEPSGTIFSEPVKLTLPNSNNLPAGTDMIILLMNSQTGQWEIGGSATVSENGNSVVSKEGQGIRHFSLAFATITAPVFKQIGAQDRPGADTFNGAMSTSISLPAVKSLESDVAASLSYKSSWAAPTAVITNLFDFPKTKTDVVPFSLAGSQEVSGNTTVTHCWDVIDGWRECRRVDINYLQRFTYDYYFSNLQSSIQPDKVETSVQVGKIKSDTKTYSQLPQRATMTYALGLFKDESANSEYLDSGIYNFQADYKIYLDQIIVGTKTEKTINTSIVNGDASHTFANTVSPYESHNPLIYPQSLTGQLFVQNYAKSEAGTGWRVNGVQKIVNPNDSKIMIEEADGSISSYSLENTIDTVLDLSAAGADPGAGVALNNLPNIAFIKDNKILEQVLGSSPASIEVASIPAVSGTLTAYDNYNYTAPMPHTYYGCTERSWGPGWNFCVAWGDVTEYYDDPFSHCSADTYTYSLKSKPTQMMYANGKIVGVDASYHSFFSASGSGYYAFNSNSNLNLNTSVQYSNNYAVARDEHNINFKNLCQSIGMNCSEPTNIRRDEVLGSNACGSYPNTSGNIIPVKGYFNSPAAIANGPMPSTVVVADYGNNRVRLLDINTGYVVKEVLGTGEVTDTYCPGGCNALNFPLKQPRGVATDAQGNIYVSSESGYIVKVSQSDVARTIAGNNLNSNLSAADVALNMKLSELPPV